MIYLHMNELFITLIYKKIDYEWNFCSSMSICRICDNLEFILVRSFQKLEEALLW